ncbi:MAG: phosphoribosylglycinamide formyltransferase [Clostridia bacterium]|nr:phosphoribosylglycinamide formyltransferase [Clostridia bacterium]
MCTENKRIAVLVSGGGTNLQALIDAEKRGELGSGEISLVISSKTDVYALERAKSNGIEALVLSRKEYANISDYSKALADTLENANIDLVVLAGFLTIIDEQVYERFPNRILNVHPALIPSFCGKGFYGLYVHEAALEKGVKLSGATVHIVTPECDAGPIVLQKAVEVKQDDTPEILQKRIMEEAEWIILPKAVRLFCEDKITVVNNKVYIKGE